MIDYRARLILCCWQTDAGKAVQLRCTNFPTIKNCYSRPLPLPLHRCVRIFLFSLHEHALVSHQIFFSFLFCSSITITALAKIGCVKKLCRFFFFFSPVDMITYSNLPASFQILEVGISFQLLFCELFACCSRFYVT